MRFPSTPTASPMLASVGKGWDAAREVPPSPPQQQQLPRSLALGLPGSPPHKQNGGEEEEGRPGGEEAGTVREHFLKLHGDGKYKNTTLAEFKEKRARFDERATLPLLSFVSIHKPILTASYEVAYLIAKQGKPHTIGEILVKPAALKMANIMLGKATENKLSQIRLSNDKISSR